MDDPTSPNQPHAPQFTSYWKWQALFGRPAPLEATWQTWLAQAQFDEQINDLRYWVNRPRA